MPSLLTASARGAVLLALILPLWARAADAPAQPAAMTLEQLAKLRSAASPQISPDGQHIAYLLSVPRQPYVDEDGSPWTELHVIGSDGQTRPYISGKVNLSRIQWTPDGQGISFLAKRPGDDHTCLYVIALAGGEARRVLQHKTDIQSYDWAPDGAHIAFVATQPESKRDKENREKGFNAIVYEEDWRPRELWIAVAEGGEDQSKPRQLEINGSVFSVQWSPTGGELALTVAPTPLIDDQMMNSKVVLVDAADGRERLRLNTLGKLGSLAWSPDGRRLALIAAEDRNDPAEGRLLVADAEDGSLRDVLPGFAGHVADIAWQDAETVMYIADEGVWSTFAKVSSDGAQRKALVPSGSHTLSGLSLSKDGLHAAMLGDSPAHPAEVFRMSHGDSTPRRLTDSNPWLEPIRWAPQEVVRFNARDGLELEAILIRPLDEQPGRRYPLILEVHGGPEAHYRNGWLTTYSRPGQVAAGRGFAVLYPNYRGSTGRGVAFSKMGQADYAGKEFDDLIDAVDHVIGLGLADGAKVGITGGSYGGYAAAWCATRHTERFAASVMFVGVSDHVSKFGTTDIPQEMYEVHSRTWPWDNWQLFRERSPIHYAQQCRTPILIMHGLKDTRVPPSQSYTLYRYLKTLGQTPVRLVLFPNEGHGNRNAASRMEYSMRMLRWMEHYLQGPGGEPPPGQLDISHLKPPADADAEAEPDQPSKPE